MPRNFIKNPKGEISQKAICWKQSHSKQTHGPTGMRSQAVAIGYAKTPKTNLLSVDNPCKEL